MNRPLTALLLAGLWLTSGCSHLAGLTRRVPARRPVPAPERKAFWNADGANGDARIVVGLAEQRAFFFRGRRLVGETGISSGRNGFETPAGQYRVIQKDEKHVSNLYGDFVDAEGQVVRRNVDLTKDSPPEGTSFSGSPMPYFLRFSKGFGFHAGHLPGRPASHGCIRLPQEMARHFFENTELGTPVRIEKSWLPGSPLPKAVPEKTSKPAAASKTKPKARGADRAVRGKKDARPGAAGAAGWWERWKPWFGWKPSS